MSELRDDDLEQIVGGLSKGKGNGQGTQLPGLNIVISNNLQQK